MDCWCFRYLLATVVQLSLAMRLLDVNTAYLYVELHKEIYIKLPPDFLKDTSTASTGKLSGLKLHKALYGLKQASCAWYNHLKRFLTANGFSCHSALPCIFVLRKDYRYAILVVYVDDINLIRTTRVCTKIENLFKDRFEIKMLGVTSFCLGLQIQHLPDGSILLHQESYVKKLLKNFNMSKCNSISAPMIGRSKTGDDSYRPCEEEEEEEEVAKHRYLAAVGALIYLATHSRPDIAFATSVLARHNRKPTHRHWAAIKHLLRYLRETEDLDLHFTRDAQSQVIEYADSELKTNEVNGKPTLNTSS